MRKIITSAMLIAVSLSSLAQDAYQPDKTEQIASYQIDAKLDTDAKMVLGTEVLTWKNTSSDTIRELMFHTYLNAFKNSKSTYFLESVLNTGVNECDYLDEQELGYIDIKRMVIVDGAPLTQDLKYVQPDDNNENDQTVMSVKLPEPVLPGNQIKLQITFLSKLPKIIARTGYERGDFYLVGQWFPKIAVYEPKGMRQRKNGGWNCHQFHYNSEFYADFGTYDVAINVPEKFKVGATGVETYEATLGDGTKTYKFHANDVIDFAWTASPRFQVITDSYDNKGVKLLCMPEHEGQAQRYMEATKHAMEYMQQNVGDYPYSQITVVDCPYYAGQAAGMEYPMFITVNTFKNTPSGIRFQEAVTVHEFVHNYFMGLVASNEFEEAWLDEGFTQFYEGLIMDKYYGDGSLVNILGFKINDTELNRTNYTQCYNPAISTISNYVWKYPSYTYSTMVYDKAQTMMQTLRGIMGEEHFNNAMKEYFAKYQFKHPSGRDFEAVINAEVAKMGNPLLGNDLGWFFQSMLRTDEVCDYKLTKIVNRRMSESKHGLFDMDLTKLFFDSSEDDSPVEYKSSVFVQRMGTMVMPVEVLVTLENGDTQLLTWDGKGRCKEFTIIGNSQVVSAQIDPQNKVACDIDLINNSVSAGPVANPVWKYASKFLFWLENIFQTVAFFA
ncbi:MAG: M1 family metallopeptidase [Bacteroidales bacterium]|nr:M1 family metallopeptidase [Bacteroidales bacterium]